jgi:hypothetical protein
MNSEGDIHFVTSAGASRVSQLDSSAASIFFREATAFSARIRLDPLSKPSIKYLTCIRLGEWIFRLFRVSAPSVDHTPPRLEQLGML